MKTLTFTDIKPNAEPREWRVRVIERGDKYGRDDCLTHQKLIPLVQFCTPDDHMVSTYYAHTLLSIPDHQGLCLDGGNREFDVTPTGIEQVKDFLWWCNHD